jgi:hypothetical protein
MIPRLSAVLPAIALALAMLATTSLHAQSIGRNGHVARLLDGRNLLGEHVAVAPRPGGNDWQAFFHFADTGEIYSGNCSTACFPRTPLAPGADRGRHVSAATRPALLGSPAFAAFYNATSGDLEALDCLNGDCSFANLRVLDTQGDVGVGTATAVDLATGRPYVAYYDASNGDLRLYRCSDAGCSSGDSVLVDGDGDRGRNPQIAISGGTMTLVYDDVDSGEVRVAIANAPYASFGRRALAAGSDAALALDATGRPDIVYTGPDGALERRRCEAASCLVLETPGALDAVPGSGIAPALTRLASGHLFATHLDIENDRLLGTLCNDADCTAPTRVTIDPEPGMGGLSIPLVFSSGGQPLVLYRDAPAAQIRSAFCTNATCGTIQRRIAGNGIVASSPDVALRPDGRAVAIWTRLRAPRIGLCRDLACGEVDYRDPVSGNSDGSRPSIVVRSDGRPFAFYSYFGGNAAWDCADADCSSGTLRDVGGIGNSSGTVTEIALRPDGRPVLLYLRRNSNDVYVFDCADVDCSSGSERLVADEPTTQSTQLYGFSIAVGDDDRPRIAYAVQFQPTPGTFAGELRLLRCDDPACTGASARTLADQAGFGDVPLAIRDDGRPVLVEQSGASRNLVACTDVDCSSATRVALPNPFDVLGNMTLVGGSVPLFGSGTVASGGYWQCDDADCAAPIRVETIRDDGGPQRGFSPRLAHAEGGAPVLVFGEQDLGDVWLTLVPPAPIFADGFEP